MNKICRGGGGVVKGRTEIWIGELVFWVLFAAKPLCVCVWGGGPQKGEVLIGAEAGEVASNNGQQQVKPVQLLL